MKISELMVGDWVAIDEPDKYHGYKGRVRIINSESEYVTVFVPHCDTEVLVDDLRPIPLTREILEKNGFEFATWSDDGLFIYYNDPGRVEVYQAESNYINGAYTYVNADVGCVSIEELPVQNLHELQHVCRMLNVDIDFCAE